MGKYTDRLNEYVNTHAVSIVSANPINGGSNLQHPSTDTVNTDTVAHAVSIVSDVSNTKPHAVSIDGVSSTPRVDALKAADELKIREWLIAINETDPDIIAELISNCRTNPKHLEYCLELADEPMLIVIRT